MDAISVLGLDQFNTGTQADFYANSISAHLSGNHAHLNKPHKHDFYAAMIFTRGFGRHDIDFNSYVVSAGSIFILSPGQTHFWELSDDIEGYIFFHTKEFYERSYADHSLRDFTFFNSITGQNSFVGTIEHVSQLQLLFRQIYEEYWNSQMKKNLLLRSLTCAVYVNLERLASSLNSTEATSAPTYRKILEAFEKLLEENFRHEKSADAYGQMLYITSKHLNRINNALLGKTTSEIINARVILEAKRLMLHSKKDLNEISFRLGYDDYAYFSRHFKKQTGQSPTEFIKSFHV